MSLISQVFFRDTRWEYISIRLDYPGPSGDEATSPPFEARYRIRCDEKRLNFLFFISSSPETDRSCIRGHIEAVVWLRLALESVTSEECYKCKLFKKKKEKE